MVHLFVSLKGLKLHFTDRNSVFACPVVFQTQTLFSTAGLNITGCVRLLAVIL
jgi:hypothetical protein